MVTNSISILAKNLGGVISENSPTILTSLAVVGLISTTVMAVKATPKALELLEDERYARSAASEFGQGTALTNKDIIKISWRCYIPTTGLAIASICCIIGANSIHVRRTAALASVYGITEAALREYQSKVIETIGKNKELKVRDEISGDRIKANPPGTSEIIWTGKGEVLCYDTLTGRYFKSSIEHIRQAINTLNRDLMSEMFITLNEFYDAIGLAGTKLGEELGWSIERGLVEISFSSQITEDSEPCLVLNYTVTPKFI
jgi:hypothetical protein